jgi:hypothetical protein
MKEAAERIVTINPETREKEVFTSHGDGSYTISTTQDVEPILEANQKRLNMYSPKAQRNVEWRLEARIPMSWLTKLQREEGLSALDPDDWKIIKKRYLNSSEYRKFRTTTNRL